MFKKPVSGTGTAIRVLLGVSVEEAGWREGWGRGVSEQISSFAI